MTCSHDATYRIENEANGGTGCPRCHAKHTPMTRTGWSTDAERAEVMAEALEKAKTLAELTVRCYKLHLDKSALLTAADIAEMEQRCNEQASDGPQYEGMWK